ncbi:hypothetical protein Z043_119093, partial [Scleropages formosus]
MVLLQPPPRMFLFEEQIATTEPLQDLLRTLGQVVHFCDIICSIGYGDIHLDSSNTLLSCSLASQPIQNAVAQVLSIAALIKFKTLVMAFETVKTSSSTYPLSEACRPDHYLSSHLLCYSTSDRSVVLCTGGGEHNETTAQMRERRFRVL